jgi:hypothetical protein
MSPQKLHPLFLKKVCLLLHDVLQIQNEDGSRLNTYCNHIGRRRCSHPCAEQGVLSSLWRPNACTHIHSTGVSDQRREGHNCGLDVLTAMRQVEQMPLNQIRLDQGPDNLCDPSRPEFPLLAETGRMLVEWRSGRGKPDSRSQPKGPF